MLDVEGKLIGAPELVLRVRELLRTTELGARSQPQRAGRRSNQVVLSRGLAPEIMALDGDRGAAPLLRERGDVVELPIEDATLLHDVDTREALDRLDPSSPR